MAAAGAAGVDDKRRRLLPPTQDGLDVVPEAAVCAGDGINGIRGQCDGLADSSDANSVLPVRRSHRSVVLWRCGVRLAVVLATLLVAIAVPNLGGLHASLDDTRYRRTMPTCSPLCLRP